MLTDAGWLESRSTPHTFTGLLSGSAYAPSPQQGRFIRMNAFRSSRQRCSVALRVRALIVAGLLAACSTTDHTLTFCGELDLTGGASDGVDSSGIASIVTRRGTITASRDSTFEEDYPNARTVVRTHLSVDSFRLGLLSATRVNNREPISGPRTDDGIKAVFRAAGRCEDAPQMQIDLLLAPPSAYRKPEWSRMLFDLTGEEPSLVAMPLAQRIHVEPDASFEVQSTRPWSYVRRVRDITGLRVSGPFVYSQSSRTFVDSRMVAWARFLIETGQFDAVANDPRLVTRLRETFPDEASSIRDSLLLIVRATLVASEVRSTRLIDGRFLTVDVDGTYFGTHPVLGYTRRAIIDLVEPNGWYLYMDWAGAEIGWPPAFPGMLVLSGTQGPIDVLSFERFLTTATPLQVDLENLDVHLFEWEVPGEHSLQTEAIRLRKLPWRCVESLPACRSATIPE
jgi:hypothetical protein